MKKTALLLLGLTSVHSFAYDFKTVEEVCGRVTGILSAHSYRVNANDACAKFKALEMNVNGKDSSYVFDIEDFATTELHNDAKEMANTALANSNLELCLKGTSKNNRTKDGIESYGFRWVEARLRAKK